MELYRRYTSANVEIPPLLTPNWEKQYRIISSEFPPINFFENLVEPHLMEELFEIESMTNDRLRDEIGDISLVAKEDRISGEGSSPVMAAFTHISTNKPSRFSNGTYGIYYAASTLETAIAETKYHRAQFLTYTLEEPGEIDMRVYIGDILKPMHDIQSNKYNALHNPDDWSKSQVFGKTMKEENSYGLVYNSVRHQNGKCIAAFKPTSISIPQQGMHLSYVWNGINITDIYHKTLLT